MPSAEPNDGSLPPTLSQWMEHDDDEYITSPTGVKIIPPKTPVRTGHDPHPLSAVCRHFNSDLPFLEAFFMNSPIYFLKSEQISI